ncbi:lysine--tRNA ligase [Patescibacteria group bacterium]
MFWADKFAKTIIKSGKHKPYWTDDMKTPSGRIHVGSLRGVITHDLIYKALLSMGVKATTSYVIEDHDPMDSLPHYLDPKKWGKYMGQPLHTVPSPEPGYKSFAEFFAKDFIEVFNACGCNPKVIWVTEIYKAGKMNKGIKICLDQAEKIRKIYKKISGSAKPKDWYPFQVVCEKCGKVGTTKVYDWDGEKVSYECLADLVSWVKGCGHKGKISPYNGNGKLPWKVEWAVKWQAIGITIEGAGKDHMSEGGSHDISSAICTDVINYPVPFNFSHEFFLIGGKKMSSSKGLGTSARDMYNLLPPQILRFLIARPRYNQAINFDPEGNTIPDLFDDFDFCAKDYYKKSKKTDFARIWELSQVSPISKVGPFFPRFRDVANYLQLTSVDINKKFEEIKGRKLNKQEQDILEERIKYAKIWLKNYAPKDLIYQADKKIPKEAENLEKEQKTYLKAVIALLEKDSWQPEDLQQELYYLSKKLNVNTKKAFQAIYIALIGKTHGPKAAWFLLDQDKNFVIKRFNDVQTQTVKKTKHLYKILNKPEIFSIDKSFKQKYPSVTIGIALIKGVVVKKTDKKLQQEIDEFISSQQDLTTQVLGEYPEIKSYRRIYKETGVDWHSKRPSPEALLRRIALKKGLYNINTCVDAYNLIVMKNRVSAGAFNWDKIKFPTVLRAAKSGDKIILLGDTKPTLYNPGEVAYFDEVGGYNINFNYLDAERTKVTEETKNLYINLEGIYEIKREQVEQSLKEVIDIILKYCGGKLEFAGIVTGGK